MRVVLLMSLTFLLAADDKAPLNRTRDREVDIHHIDIIYASYQCVNMLYECHT